MGWFSRKKPKSQVAAGVATPVRDCEADRVKANTAGSFRGKHFSEWSDDIQLLKREGRDDEALALAFECINATERQNAVDRLGLAPGYYTQAAILLRKQKRFVEEVDVIDRYLDGRAIGAIGASNAELEDRRRKAIALRDAASEADMPHGCPSCGVALEKLPASKGECASCGQVLVVRKIDGQSKVFTPEQSADWVLADKQKKQRNKFLKIVSPWSVTETEWDREATQLTARFGTTAQNVDVFWAVANASVVRFSKSADWNHLHWVYSAMEKQLVAEGRDWVETGRAKARAEAQFLAQYDADSTEMILLTCKCPVCVVNDLKVVTLGAAKRAWPFPHEACEKAPCCCKVMRKLY